MAHVACYTSESSHLLVNTASEDSSSLLQRKSVCISCPPSKHLCLPSKAAILILLWTIIVGATYHNLVGLSALLILSNPTPSAILSEYEPLPYAVLAIVMMFYLLSGFIADVCCGRLKAVIISLISFVVCWVLVFMGLTTLVTIPHPTVLAITYSRDFSCHSSVFSLVAFLIGLVGYQANFIQLGLIRLTLWSTNLLSRSLY